jgi:hypothetical protein
VLLLISSPPGSELRFVTSPVKEGEHSLFLAVAGPGESFVTQLLCVGAERFLFRRSLAAGLTIHLAVQPESVGPDARVLVDAQLSEHAPRENHGILPVFVRYLLGESGPPRRDGQVYLVPVPLEPGRWNELELPLTKDAVRGFRRARARTTRSIACLRRPGASRAARPRTSMTCASSRSVRGR